jgi:hypothetical protein
MNKNYFCRAWEETTGDPLTDDWGTSIWHFETDDQLNVLRQMQIFANGQTLKYDADYLEDQYGKLSETAIDAEDFARYAINSEVFEDQWRS